MAGKMARARVADFNMEVVLGDGDDPCLGLACAAIGRRLDAHFVRLAIEQDRIVAGPDFHPIGLERLSVDEELRQFLPGAAGGWAFDGKLVVADP